MRRRWLQLFLIAGAALLLGAAALPWWLGHALRWAGGPLGLTFSRYERIGYTRFALHHAEVRHAVVRVTVARIEADTPLVAWWRHGEIRVDPWQVRVTPRGTAVAPALAASGWVPLQSLLHRIALQLDRWAPRVSAQAGIVSWPGTELNLASANWSGRTLAVQALRWRELQADAELQFRAEACRLTVRSRHGGGTWESLGPEVTGSLTAWDQPAELVAHFGASGWLPIEAALVGTGWQVPGDKLRLGASYTTVRGHGKIEWRERTLWVGLAASGDPIPGSTVPPLEAQLRGHGDLNAFTFEEVQATLPGLAVRLSEAVTVERSGTFRASGAHFSLAADLAQLPWFTSQGSVAGEAWLESGLTSAPTVAFQLVAHDLATAGWSATRAEAKGEINWPKVQVSAGTLTGRGDENLVWRGGWDFAAKEVLDAAVEGRIRRETLARWLPADLGFDAITLAAKFAGPLATLRHAGRAQADAVTYQTLQPCGLTLEWAGQGGKLDSLAAQLTAGTTKISARGTHNGEITRLDEFELAQGEVMRLRLTAPAQIRWRPGLQVDSLHLAGPDGAIDAAVAWGDTGRVELAVRGFSSTWLSELGKWRGPAWQLTTLKAAGAWDHGPMTFTLNGQATVAWSTGRSTVLAVSAQGDPSGVRLAELSVVEENQRVVQATGRIPLRLSPRAAPWAEFDPAGALALAVTTAPHAGFWSQLTTFTGLELIEPEATAEVSGTWAAPRATVRVKAARVAWDAARFPYPMPTLSGIDLELAGELGEVRLDRLAVKIEDQAVRARGRWPLAPGKWGTLLETPWAAVPPGAEGHLEVPAADLAALARFLPDLVVPKGRLHLDVTYQDGALGGSLRLQDAATRPLGPLGALQEINADLAFVGHRVELRSVTAQTGGQTVTLGGSVELPDLSPARAAPQAGARNDALDGFKFDLTLAGENLPLVRQTGVLVRGDLNLKLTSPARGSPRITGTVRLRDSLFLSDVRALLPGGARTKARPPPYFTVAQEPFAAWRLDVLLIGDRFLKLRTALFNGLASARFQLNGTLGEPSVRGDATIDEGLVKLPFATFVVQEGRVTVTPEQGIEPQVWFVGTVRRLSHDLRLEASGPASAPLVVFSSSPPMESGQVLLMVMTGESPRDGVVYTDRQRMTRLGTFLGQSLLASFGGESEAGDRLSLSTGENVSRQGRETYGIEYRLNEKWALVGEYDEFDDFNAGVKWRVYSRGGEKEKRK